MEDGACTPVAELFAYQNLLSIDQYQHKKAMHKVDTVGKQAQLRNLEEVLNQFRPVPMHSIKCTCTCDLPP
jgi:hypothetical protein